MTNSENNQSVTNAGHTHYSNRFSNVWAIPIMVAVISLLAFFSFIRHTNKVSTLELLCSLEPSECQGVGTVFTDNSDEFNNISEQVSLALSELPAELIESFERNEWNLVFLWDANVTQREWLAKVLDTKSTDIGSKLKAFKGITVKQNKVILINMAVEPLENELKEVILHEFGHYFQLKHMSLEETLEWQEVYKPLTNTEKWVSVDSRECFSEIFSDILASDVTTYPDNEREQYKFVQSQIDKLN